MTTSKKLSLGSAAKIAPQVETKPATVLPDQTGTIGPAAPPLPISAVPGGHWASVTAQEIAEDATFQKDMEAACDADEVSRRKVYTVLHDLHRIFEADEMANWPLLKPTLKDRTPAQHNLFIAEYATTKKNKDGKDVSGTGNRYDDLAHALPWIKAWDEYKSYCVEARKDGQKRKADHAEWSAYRWDAEIKKYSQRIRNGVGMIKQSVAVHLQMQEINKLPQVGCGLMTTEAGSLVEVGEPMAVWSKVQKDPLTQQPLSTCASPSAFLAMKVAKAIDAAGGDPSKVTYAMLLASAGRVTGTGAGTTEPVIKSLDTLEGTLAETAAYLNQDSVQAAIRAKLAGKDKKGNPLMSDGYILSIYDAHMQLDVIATMPEFAQRAKALVLARAQEGMAKMQAAAATKAA